MAYHLTITTQVGLSLDAKRELAEKYKWTCDGCDREIGIDEKVLDDITSCCGGGCSRKLCGDCIKRAAHELTEQGG